MGFEVTLFIVHEVSLPKHARTGMREVNSAISFTRKATFEGYKNFAISYLICMEDKCVFPELQQRIVNILVNEAGVDVDVHKMQSGHCPSISRTKNVGFLIRRLVRE
ncbi:uncharacterized protein A1O9_05635, partial [Exophiala aquamarina CBS 119918]